MITDTMFIVASGALFVFAIKFELFLPVVGLFSISSLSFVFVALVSKASLFVPFIEKWVGSVSDKYKEDNEAVIDEMVEAASVVIPISDVQGRHSIDTLYNCFSQQHSLL